MKKREKLNQKGFAVSGIMYPLFVLFVGLLIGLIAMFMNRKLLFDQTKKDVLSEVNYGKSVLEGGLLLYYRGSDEPINVNAVMKLEDVSGNGNHGEMVNFQENTRNEQGKILLDGTNNYVKAPNVLSGRTAFTIEIAYIPKRTISWEYVFGIKANQFGLERNNAGGSNFYYSNNGATNKHVSVTATKNENNKLTYATYVFDGRNFVGYKDGMRILTTNLDSNPVVTGSYLGLGADGSGDYKTQMECYSFRVYNYALNDDEVYHNFKIDKRFIEKIETPFVPSQSTTPTGTTGNPTGTTGAPTTTGTVKPT
ncbi:MAG: LamG domain-containing protein [Firmicutes bacterium]|nr:LamG domain-containing protein [Bacillota bacterium]